MVPATPGSRLASLFAFVAGVPFAALDRAAGVAEGTAKQCARGKKVGPIAADAFAPIFGTTAEYVLFGRGAKPLAADVRAAVAARVGDEHAAPVRSRA